MKKARIMLVAAILLAMTGMVQAMPKVLYIDSYHTGYPWSDGITESIANTFGYKYEGGQIISTSSAKVELQVYRMDTKLMTGLEIPADATPEQVKEAKAAFMADAAEKAKAKIEAWKPDVVIASDDNASKYLIVPHFKEASVPFIFCGVNWDASGYGFPCSNVTGMLEAALVPQLIDAMGDFAKGDRVGFLGGSTLTDQKEVENIQKKFNVTLNVVAADDFEAWKTGYKKLQDETDMVIMNTTSGVKSFDMKAAKSFVLENTKVPTGCVQAGESAIALMGYTKLPQEQGQWAAETALKILNGESVGTIPVAVNKKGQIYLNMPLAAKMKIKFPLAMVKQAKIVKETEMAKD